MIEVHTINGELFFINPDMIETMRSTPDTVLFLINGKRILIKDTPEEVIERIVSFRKLIYEDQFYLGSAAHSLGTDAGEHREIRD